MIIGISGKAQSGKDTTARIIQLLMYTKNRPTITVMDCLNDKNLDLSRLDIETEWQVKKFFDKPKQMAAILLGCTVADFEDESFKSSTLQDLADRGIISKQFIDSLPD
jgi:CO dehydrogenase nickel-insertion accessory protein CooC1